MLCQQPKAIGKISLLFFADVFIFSYSYKQIFIQVLYQSCVLPQMYSDGLLSDLCFELKIPQETNKILNFIGVYLLHAKLQRLYRVSISSLHARW